MAFFSNKRRGSIVLFVLISIATLSAVVLIFQSGKIHKKRFYESVGSEYGFIDDNGNLHGRKIVEREVESILNLMLGVIQGFSRNEQVFLFFTSYPQMVGNKMRTDLDRLAKLYEHYGRTFTHAGMTNVRLANAELRNIRHNPGVVVDSNEIAIFPLDDKIPFTEKFEGEIRKLIGLVFADPTVLVGNDATRTAAADEIVGLIGSEGEISVGDVDDFAELQSWKRLFGGNVQKERNAIKLLRDSLCFCKDVEAVNFFIANKYVQRAICEAYNQRRSDDAIDYSQHGQEAFVFDENGLVKGLVFDENTNLENYRKLIAMLQDMTLLDLEKPMNKDSFAMWEKGEREKAYAIRNKDKILLWNDRGTMSSYSKVIGITVSVYDKEYPAFKAEKTYICKLPKCEAYPKE